MPPYHALSISGNQGCTPFLPGLLRPSLLCRLPFCRGMQQYVSIICHPPFFCKRNRPPGLYRSGSRLPRSLPLHGAMWIRQGKGITDKCPELAFLRLHNPTPAVGKLLRPPVFQIFYRLLRTSCIDRMKAFPLHTEKGKGIAPGKQLPYFLITFANKGKGTFFYNKGYTNLKTQISFSLL